MPTKTDDAVKSLIETLNTYGDLANSLFDADTADRATIAAISKDRDAAIAKVTDLTQQLAATVDDSSTAATITAAGAQLSDKLKVISDKAAAATPPQPVASTPA